MSVNKYVIIAGFALSALVSAALHYSKSNFRFNQQSYPKLSQLKTNASAQASYAQKSGVFSIRYGVGNLEFRLSQTNVIHQFDVYHIKLKQWSTLDITQYFNIIKLTHGNLSTNIPVDIAVTFVNEDGNVKKDLKGYQLGTGNGAYKSLDTLLSTNAGIADYTFPPEAYYNIGNNRKSLTIRVEPATKSFSLIDSSPNQTNMIQIK